MRRSKPKPPWHPMTAAKSLKARPLKQRQSPKRRSRPLPKMPRQTPIWRTARLGLELLNVVSKMDGKRSVKRKRSPAMTSLVEALGEQIADSYAEDEVSQEEETAVAEAAPAPEPQPEPQPEPEPEPEPEAASCRVLWDVLIAERQDKEACVEDFIACVDRLFMPEGTKPADEDLVSAMKSAAAQVLASKTGPDAFVQPAATSTGT